MGASTRGATQPCPQLPRSGQREQFWTASRTRPRIAARAARPASTWTVVASPVSGHGRDLGSRWSASVVSATGRTTVTMPMASTPRITRIGYSMWTSFLALNGLSEASFEDQPPGRGKAVLAEKADELAIVPEDLRAEALDAEGLQVLHELVEHLRRDPAPAKIAVDQDRVEDGDRFGQAVFPVLQGPEESSDERTVHLRSEGDSQVRFFERALQFPFVPGSAIAAGRPFVHASQARHVFPNEGPDLQAVAVAVVAVHAAPPIPSRAWRKAPHRAAPMAPA